MAALTHVQARERAELLDVHSYTVDIDLTRGDEVFGVDTLIAMSEVDDEGRSGLVIVHNGRRPHLIAVGGYDVDASDPGRLVPRARIEVRVPADAERVALSWPDHRDRADLVVVNDGDFSFCKVRFDPTSWQTVTQSLCGIVDPLTRAVVWTSARHLVRDGELPPLDYLDLAARHLPAETDTAIVASVLRFAREQVADRYVDDNRRPFALGVIARVCRELLDVTAEPGLRLAALRVLIDSGMSTDTAELIGWLAAGTLPGGQALDSDLRWQLLLRLVVLGGATRVDIDAESARDRTWSGQCGAATCRAALGDPIAKQAAWRAMFDADNVDGELLNDLLAATAQGFWQPEQRELLAGYLPRYCGAAVDIAARRGSTIAMIVGRHGFPAYAVNEEVRQAVEECLRSANPTPALRRQLTDQLDDLNRALRVRRL